MEREHIDEAVKDLAARLTVRGWWLATAESCTGGLVACELTNVSGSSGWYVGGVVAYANRIKQDMLGVDEKMLTSHGAVSRETVLAMVQGAASRFRTECAIAISGVAGPTGGTPEKPVGTVWIGWFVNGSATAKHFLFTGDRLGIKRQSALAAIKGIATLIR